MKSILKHFVEKLFATKIETPCRDSLQEVKEDIKFLKDQYESIGMKLIDISYKEHVRKTHTLEDGQVWLHKTYMSYVVLYFIKA